jgi:hypothetical protein
MMDNNVEKLVKMEKAESIPKKNQLGIINIII